MKDAASYALVQQRIAQACEHHGLTLRDYVESAITGVMATGSSLYGPAPEF